jgi:hypothetical protein
MSGAPAPVGGGDVRSTEDVLPAAFWDVYPENREDNADYAAIQAILEECTPDERAETCKACSRASKSLA